MMFIISKLQAVICTEPSRVKTPRNQALAAHKHRSWCNSLKGCLGWVGRARREQEVCFHPQVECRNLCPRAEGKPQNRRAALDEQARACPERSRRGGCSHIFIFSIHLQSANHVFPF